MRTIFSTSGIHPEECFDYWHSYACSEIVDHHSIPEIRENFEAELSAGSIGDVRLISFQNSPMRIIHDARHVRATPTDHLFVYRQLSGELGVEQDGREILMGAGDFALFDPRLPYQGVFRENSQSLLIKVARELLESRIGNTRDFLARRGEVSHPQGRFLSNYLSFLATHPEGLDGLAAGLIRDQLLDHLSLSLLALRNDTNPRLTARSRVRLRLRVAIRANASDPSADAGSLAAAAGISLRYANAILAEEDLSVMRLLMHERLARCRESLIDPVQASRTVSEIAYSWGFSDMTHFSRSFRKQYGSAPTAYRRAHQSNKA